MRNKTKMMDYISQNGFITSAEAMKLGVNPMSLSRLALSGDVFRVEHGIYAKDLGFLTDEIGKYAIACSKYKGAVVAGISGLSFHSLTDEQEERVWLAVKKGTTIENPTYRMMRLSGVHYSLGIEEYIYCNRVVRIYDNEKCVVDAFKYLWEEVAYKALKGYLKRNDRNIKKLCEYSAILKRPLDEAIAAILADD